MTAYRLLLALVACLAGAAGHAQSTRDAAPAPAALQVPIDYYKLDNGLKVVLSQDTSAPTVTVGVYYGIGFRIEPKGRTGFAHLFEHLMFQGSANLGKAEFGKLVESQGGLHNGSTRFDYTNYFQTIPAHTLETILWAEADRMASLRITPETLASEKGVVKSEVRVNVLNQPYGGFPWLWMPQHANTNWYNAHNFYGDLADLDAATLEDVQRFFDDYYVPGNAVLVVAGDFEVAQAKQWIAKYFGRIAARPTPQLPDISEPRQEAEKRVSYVDKLAPKPALALAWHVPPRGTPEHFALGIVDQLLLQGDDSTLHQRLIKERGYSSSVSGGINLLGNQFNYAGPMLYMLYLVHDAGVAPDAIIADVDAAVAALAASPPASADMDRALTKIRADLYDTVGSNTRWGLVDLLASYALFDDDPQGVNRIEAGFRAVTPELVQQVARDWLAARNRTVLILEPGRTPPAAATATGAGQ